MTVHIVFSHVPYILTCACSGFNPLHLFSKADQISFHKNMILRVSHETYIHITLNTALADSSVLYPDCVAIQEKLPASSMITGEMVNLPPATLYREMDTGSFSKDESFFHIIVGAGNPVTLHVNTVSYPAMPVREMGCFVKETSSTRN